jgi:hypothetical protein
MKLSLQVFLNSIFLSLLLSASMAIAVREPNRSQVEDNSGNRSKFQLLQAQNPQPSSNPRIDLINLTLDGGVPKDGIPSIDNPKFESAKTTKFAADELVIGVVVGNQAKAYPLKIMNWHEIVNDTVGGKNLTISYCPLCDTIVVFERGKTTYGVSGKLYQSCLVMYDRTDETLYSQPWAMGIAGTGVNRHLSRIPGIKTTLGKWFKQHPNSQILSAETGANRDYGSSAISGNQIGKIHGINFLEVVASSFIKRCKKPELKLSSLTGDKSAPFGIKSYRLLWWKKLMANKFGSIVHTVLKIDSKPYWAWLSLNH